MNNDYIQLEVDLLISREPGDYVNYEVCIRFDIQDFPILIPQVEYMRERQGINYKFGEILIAGRIHRLHNPYGVRLVKLSKKILTKVFEAYSGDKDGYRTISLYSVPDELDTRWLRTEILVDKTRDVMLYNYIDDATKTYGHYYMRK